MRKTQLLQEFYERQKAKSSTVKVGHIEAVVSQRLGLNPQWGYRDLYELEAAIGLPKNSQSPLVRWTARLPHGAQNNVWCFPTLFPALPTQVAASRNGKLGPVWPFEAWARTVGLIADVERRYRKVIFYWPHSDRNDSTWVNRAMSAEFGIAMACDVDPYRPYASTEEFESCL